jgi:hypothetical protein
MASTPSEAQLRDVLDDLLGRSDEILEVQEVEGSDAEAKFRVLLAEIESPEEVELTLRFLDSSLRSLDDFRSDKVLLVAGGTEVMVRVAYDGASEVRSAVIEVNLERGGQRFARRRIPRVRRWSGAGGLRADLGAGDGSETGAPGAGESSGEVIVIVPRPLGNTPSNTPGDDSGSSFSNSSGGTSGGTTSGSTSGTSGGGTTSGGGLVLTAPTGGFIPASTTCSRAVQGKIAWNYSGAKTWGTANVARLCKGAMTSEQPARCFERVMHGGINWGGGTRWQFENALDLCEGSTNASATVSCFQGELGANGTWRKAIDTCGK